MGETIKLVNAFDLTCSECAMVNLYQPCEACPNYSAQRRSR